MKTKKRCRGVLHPPGGEILPASEFWVYKSGKKKGMLFYQCKRCLKWPKAPKLGKIDSFEQRRILQNYKRIYPGIFKTEKGILYKRCSGPSHEEPTWLPAESKYFYMTKRGTLYNRCRLCCAYAHAEIPEDSGFIPASKVVQYFREAVWRVGQMETARRISLTDTQLRAITSGKSRYVRKATFKRLMLELISMRRKHEVRHRDSIKYGATLRGKPERTPTHRTDFNKPTGDDDLERRKNYRREHLEQERETERTRRRLKKTANG